MWRLLQCLLLLATARVGEFLSLLGEDSMSWLEIIAGCCLTALVLMLTWCWWESQTAYYDDDEDKP